MHHVKVADDSETNKHFSCEKAVALLLGKVFMVMESSARFASAGNFWIRLRRELIGCQAGRGTGSHICRKPSDVHNTDSDLDGICNSE